MSSASSASGSVPDQVMQALRVRVEQLQTDNSKLCNERIEAESRCAELEAKYTEAVNERKAFETHARDVIKQWAASHQQARKEQHDAESQVAMLNAQTKELIELQARTSQLRAEVTAELQETRAHAEATITSLKAQLDTANVALATLKAENEQASTHYEASTRVLRKELSDTKDELRDAVELAASFKGSLESLRAERDGRTANDTAASEQLRQIVTRLQAELASAVVTTNEAREVRSALSERVSALQDEVDRINEEKRELSLQAQSRWTELNQSLAASEAERQRLLEVCDEIKLELTAKATTLESCESDVVELRDTTATMTRMIRELETALIETRTQSQEIDAERVAAVEAARLQLQTMTALQEDLSRSHAAAAEQGDVIVELQKQLDDKTSQLAAITESHEQHLVKLESAQMRVTVFETSCAQMQLQIDELSKSLSAKDEACATAEAANENLQRLLKTSQETVSGHELMISELQTMTVTLRAQLSSECERNASEAHALQQQLEAANCKLHVCEGTIEELQQHVGRITAERDLFRSQLSASQRERRDLETMVHVKFDAMDAEALSAAEDNRRITSERDSLVAKLAAVEDSIQGYRDEAERVRSLLSESLARHGELERELESARETIDDCKHRISVFERDATAKATEIQRVRREMDVQLSRASDLDLSNHRLSDDLRALQKELKAARSEKEALQEQLVLKQQHHEAAMEREMNDVKAYMETKAEEREALIKRYNALHTAYKDVKMESQKLAQQLRVLQAPVANNTADTEIAAQQMQLRNEETLTKLRQMVELGRQQESELERLREQNTILHEVVTNQLEAAELVDVNRVLRDKSVTVHQLNLAEGPRRAPMRRTGMLSSSHRPSGQRFGAASSSLGQIRSHHPPGPPDSVEPSSRNRSLEIHEDRDGSVKVTAAPHRGTDAAAAVVVKRPRDDSSHANRENALSSRVSPSMPRSPGNAPMPCQTSQKPVAMHRSTSAVPLGTLEDHRVNHMM